MLKTIVFILIILWILGYAPISGITIPNLPLFDLNGHMVTLWEVLILAVVGWAIGILPRPFQAVASVLLVLWLLSVLGLLTIVGSNVIVIVIIIALILSILR